MVVLAVAVAARLVPIAAGTSLSAFAMFFGLLMAMVPGRRPHRARDPNDDGESSTSSDGGVRRPMRLVPSATYLAEQDQRSPSSTRPLLSYKPLNKEAIHSATVAASSASGSRPQLPRPPSSSCSPVEQAASTKIQDIACSPFSHFSLEMSII